MQGSLTAQAYRGRTNGRFTNSPLCQPFHSWLRSLGLHLRSRLARVCNRPMRCRLQMCKMGHFSQPKSGRFILAMTLNRDFLVQSVEGEHPCFLENYDKCPVLPISHTKHRGAWRRPSQKNARRTSRPSPQRSRDRRGQRLFRPPRSPILEDARRSAAPSHCPPAVPPMRRAQHGGPFAARQRSAHG